MPYSVGGAPDFSQTKKIYVLVSTWDDNFDGDAGIPPMVGNIEEEQTHIVSSVGISCGWDEVAELFYDCDGVTPNSFEIEHGSRFAFCPNFETTRQMWIGVAGDSYGVDDQGGGCCGGGNCGGDVYTAWDTIPPSDALDLNVQGYTSGCLGLAPANIMSLDICDAGYLVAGAYDGFCSIGTDDISTNVWVSMDGGWSWTPSAKDPTGMKAVYVKWYNGCSTILAGTWGCDCALSMSCGEDVGLYFNQIAFVNTCIDEVWDLTHAPGYLDGNNIMYVLTYCDDCCDRPGYQEGVSLWRWNNVNWERVYSSRSWEFDLIDSDGLMEWVEVSPDFNTTGCLYLANSCFQMFRSVDQGCSWRVLSFPCAPRPTITAWIVVDENTVLAAGGGGAPSNGWIWKTDRYGTRPWTPQPTLAYTGIMAEGQGVDFDLSPNIGTDNTVLFSNDLGQVFISQDLSETPWVEITDAVNFTSFGLGDSYNTYCVFDPGYGTAGDPGENMIYAAGGSLVGRCNLNAASPMSMQDWVYINNAAATCDPMGLCNASGIDAAGDTALYVLDSGREPGDTGEYMFEGTIGIMYGCEYGDQNCTCDIEVDGPWRFVNYTSGSGFVLGEPVQILSYNLECVVEDFWVTPPMGMGNAIEGEVVVEGLVSGTIGIFEIFEYVDWPFNPPEWECPYCYENGAMIVISGVLTITDVPTASGYCCTGIWRTLNPMDLMPPVEWPVPLVEWEFLGQPTDPVTGLCLTPPTALMHRQAGGICSPYTGVTPDDLWLTAGSNMLWTLDDDGTPIDMECPTDTIWMWNDILAVPVVQIAPSDGALLATTTTATIEWTPITGALLYEVFVYSFCPTCPNNMIIDQSFTTDLTCVVIDGLIPGQKYFWKVRVACDSPYASKWSDVRAFNTSLGAVPYLCSPWCGQDGVQLNTNFSWDPVVGATSYEVDIAADEAFSSIVASGTPTANAWAPGADLDYSTTYYWRVRAVSDGVYSAWAVCIFTTMAEEPVPVVEEVELVQVTEEITPTWIWVIIGIGAALVICVIILIVTTRRVP